MNALGNSKVVHSKEVLVIKLKRDSSVGPTELAAVLRDIDSALRSVTVESCRETKSGAVVMNFPSKEAKKDASAPSAIALVRNCSKLCLN